MRWRSRDIGTRCSGRAPSAARAAADGAVRRGALARRGAAGAGGVARGCAAAREHVALGDAAAAAGAVDRRPASTPCSAIILRAAGSAVTRAGAGAAGAGARRGAGCGGGCGAGAAAAAARRRVGVDHGDHFARTSPSRRRP